MFKKYFSTVNVFLMLFLCLFWINVVAADKPPVVIGLQAP